MNPKQRAILLGLAIVLVALVASVIWLLLRDGETPAAPDAEPAGAPTPSVRPTAPRAVAPPTNAGTPPDAGSRPLEYADDGIPIMPAGPDDPRPDGPVHPHPITAEHRRIYYENHLLSQLDGAMDVKDVPGMRRILKEYREKYPEDGPRLQSGYELIANCLEHPGHHRQEAQRYFDEERGSTLRRYVLRHCLDGPR